MKDIVYVGCEKFPCVTEAAHNILLACHSEQVYVDDAVCNFTVLYESGIQLTVRNKIQRLC